MRLFGFSVNILKKTKSTYSFYEIILILPKYRTITIILDLSNTQHETWKICVLVSCVSPVSFIFSSFHTFLCMTFASLHYLSSIKLQHFNINETNPREC